MKRMIVGLLSAMAILGFSLTANAAQIASSADLALAGGTLINFDSETQGSYSSTTINGVTFSGIDGNYSLTSAYSGDFNATGISLQNGLNGYTQLQIDFTGTASAFGFNFGASNEDWALRSFGSDGVVIEEWILPQTWWSNNGDYFGLSGAGMSYATMTQLTHVNDSAGDHILFDNFTFVSESVAVPAPSTLSILGFGLLGFVLRATKKKSQKNS